MIIESVEAAQSELAALRQQIAVLEQSVGEAQQREAASRARAERLLFLCEAASEGIVIQERGRVTDANHVVPQMFGYMDDEIIGMEVMNFISSLQSGIGYAIGR